MDTISWDGVCVWGVCVVVVCGVGGGVWLILSNYFDFSEKWSTLKGSKCFPFRVNAFFGWSHKSCLPFKKWRIFYHMYHVPLRLCLFLSSCIFRKELTHLCRKESSTSTLERSIFNWKGVWLVFIIVMAYRNSCISLQWVILLYVMVVW